MALRTLAVLLAAVILSGSAQAHGDFRWVMENRETSWCCGPEDCRDLRPGEARFTADGWRVNGYPVPRAHVFESPEAHEQHMSACFKDPPANTVPRCLFRVPAKF